MRYIMQRKSTRRTNGFLKMSQIAISSTSIDGHLSWISGPTLKSRRLSADGRIKTCMMRMMMMRLFWQNAKTACFGPIETLS